LSVDSGFDKFSLCVLEMLSVTSSGGVFLGDVVCLLQGFVVHLRDVGRNLHDVVGIPPDVLDFRFLIASARASRKS
jgi:hypothetical protein